MTSSDIWRLKNEFASVWVEVDHSANGPLLRICDVSTGQDILLDPLQLEALAWANPEDLAFLMDPKRRESVADPEQS